MKRHLPAAAVCLVLGVSFAGGCGAPPPPGQMNQRMTTEDRARLNAGPRDDFEAGKEVPIGADTHFAAGQFAESQGKMNLAMEQYRKAMTLNPNHRPTLF